MSSHGLHNGIAVPEICVLMSTGFPESRFSLSADAGEKWFSISCLVSARLGFSVTVSSSKMESSCNPILSKLPLAVDALPAVLLIIRIVALPQRFSQGQRTARCIRPCPLYCLSARNTQCCCLPKQQMQSGISFRRRLSKQIQRSIQKMLFWQVL